MKHAQAADNRFGVSVLMAIAAHSDNRTGKSRASIVTIARKAGCSPRSASRTVLALESRCVIERRHRSRLERKLRLGGASEFTIIHDDGSFLPVSHAWLDRYAALGVTARRAYAGIRAEADGRSRFQEEFDKLRLAIGCSRATFYRAIEELDEHGLLRHSLHRGHWWELPEIKRSTQKIVSKTTCASPKIVSKTSPELYRLKSSELYKSKAEPKHDVQSKPDLRDKRGVATDPVRIPQEHHCDHGFVQVVGKKGDKRMARCKVCLEAEKERLRREQAEREEAERERERQRWQAKSQFDSFLAPIIPPVIDRTWESFNRLLHTPDTTKHLPPEPDTPSAAIPTLTYSAFWSSIREHCGVRNVCLDVSLRRRVDGMLRKIAWASPDEFDEMLSEVMDERWRWRHLRSVVDEEILCIVGQTAGLLCDAEGIDNLLGYTEDQNCPKAVYGSTW